MVTCLLPDGAISGNCVVRSGRNSGTDNPGLTDNFTSFDCNSKAGGTGTAKICVSGDTEIWWCNHQHHDR